MTPRSGAEATLQKPPSFPVLREFTGKNPGFGPGPRQNIIFDQLLVCPIPRRENREIIRWNRGLNLRNREITGKPRTGRFAPAQSHRQHPDPDPNHSRQSGQKYGDDARLRTLVRRAAVCGWSGAAGRGLPQPHGAVAMPRRGAWRVRARARRPRPTALARPRPFDRPVDVSRCFFECPHRRRPVPMAGLDPGLRGRHRLGSDNKGCKRAVRASRRRLRRLLSMR